MTHALFRLLDRLDRDHIHYVLGRDRPDTIRVLVTVPGERIEIDVFGDGHLEVARFTGDEAILGGEDTLDDLLSPHAS